MTASFAVGLANDTSENLLWFWQPSNAFTNDLCFCQLHRSPLSPLPAPTCHDTFGRPRQILNLELFLWNALFHTPFLCQDFLQTSKNDLPYANMLSCFGFSKSMCIPSGTVHGMVAQITPQYLQQQSTCPDTFRSALPYNFLHILFLLFGLVSKSLW